jgi:hypothetical protein
MNSTHKNKIYILFSKDQTYLKGFAEYLMGEDNRRFDYDFTREEIEPYVRHFTTKPYSDDSKEYRFGEAGDYYRTVTFHNEYYPYPFTEDKDINEIFKDIGDRLGAGSYIDEDGNRIYYCFKKEWFSNDKSYFISGLSAPAIIDFINTFGKDRIKLCYIETNTCINLLTNLYFNQISDPYKYQRDHIGFELGHIIEEGLLNFSVRGGNDNGIPDRETTIRNCKILLDSELKDFNEEDMKILKEFGYTSIKQSEPFDTCYNVERWLLER